MEPTNSSAPLMVAVFMYAITITAVILLKRKPESSHFDLSAFICDVDRAIAIGSVFIGTTSFVLWLSPVFIETEHQLLPFIYWLAGGSGVLTFLLCRLRRNYNMNGLAGADRYGAAGGGGGGGGGGGAGGGAGGRGGAPGQAGESGQAGT